ncbi:MAG TPA: FAD-dependent oxidoreductase, partial [Longimicrobium sp.]|nr:FAD-dependent oxidoreductase [Longimicrobium sp.]
ENGFYENTPLYEIGFWNLLQHYLSSEAFQFIHDALSLESVLGNWSAAEAIPWFTADFASSELFMVPDGMQELIKRLHESVVEAGERFQLHLGKKVTKCRYDAQAWQVYTGPKKEPVHVYFDALILALPKAALEQLCIKDRETAWRPSWLSEVQPHVLYKLFLLYEQEWWMGDEEPGYSVGRTFTDLPVRQVYYFSPKWMKASGRCASAPGLRKVAGTNGATAHWSLVMASYSDEHYVDFWRPFSGEKENVPYYKAPSKVEGSRAEFLRKVEQIPEELRAGERIVKKVQQQLQEIHGHIIPEPVLGLYKDWGLPPFGAGWHTWNVGSKPWTYRPAAEQENVTDLYICGEAFSAEQGWIEGALKTVENVLISMGVPEMKYEHGWGVPDLHDYVGAPKEDKPCDPQIVNL